MSTTNYIQRQHRFSTATWHKDKETGKKVDDEINNVVDFVNNLSRGTVQLSNHIFVAPDGKLFKLSVIYAADGVTPVTQWQQVTFP